MRRLLYTGREGFTVPEPADTQRKVKRGDGQFWCLREVAVLFLAALEPRHESDPVLVRHINRYRQADERRSLMLNVDLPPMEFRTGEVTEVDDDIAELLLVKESRYWTDAEATGHAAPAVSDADREQGVDAVIPKAPTPAAPILPHVSQQPEGTNDNPSGTIYPDTISPSAPPAPASGDHIT